MVKVAPPCPEQLLGSLAIIPLPDRFQNRPPSGKIDVEHLALYDRYGIEVPLFRFGKPERRWLRVSAQIYNSPADCEFLASALETL